MGTVIAVEVHAKPCYCEDCEAAQIAEARDARMEARAEREERLAHPNAHPLIWR